MSQWFAPNAAASCAGGFGKKGKHDLAEVLKRALKQSGRRRELRVLEVGCLG